MSNGATLNYSTNVEVRIDHDSHFPEGFTYESRDSKSKIAYQAIIESRDWGIKSVSFLALAQNISLSIELMDENSGEVEFFDFNVKVNKIDSEVSEVNLANGVKPEVLNLVLSNIKKVDSSKYEAEADATLSFS